MKFNSMILAILFFRLVFLVLVGGFRVDINKKESIEWK